MSSSAPEYLDMQADALSGVGQDITANEIRGIAAEFRAMQKQVADLERENSRLAIDLTTANTRQRECEQRYLRLQARVQQLHEEAAVQV